MKIVSEEEQQELFTIAKREIMYDYDEIKESSYIFYLDLNSQYV